MHGTNSLKSELPLKRPRNMLPSVLKLYVKGIFATEIMQCVSVIQF